MGTLHRFAESAIRRDLARARAVLDGGARLAPERRRILVDHLLWMVALVEPAATAVAVAARHLARTITEFDAEPDRIRRGEVIAALDSFLRLTRDQDLWTAPVAMRRLGTQVPWLLDGLAMPPGRGLVVNDPASPDERRVRAAAYQRTRTVLWGTAALTMQHPGIAVSR